LEALKIAAVLIAPFMLGSAAKIMEQLGIFDPASQNFQGIRNWRGLPAGSGLKCWESLFPRVEIRMEEPNPVKSNKAAVPTPIKPEFSYEKFEKVDLRVAKVLATEIFPK